jgi:hypothetical protein
VSTQPVDKGQQAEVIPHLRDSGFILHPLDRDEPGLCIVSFCIRFAQPIYLHGEFSLTLQERSIGVDELVGLNVLDSYTRHFVGI